MTNAADELAHSRSIISRPPPPTSSWRAASLHHAHDALSSDEARAVDVVSILPRKSSPRFAHEIRARDSRTIVCAFPLAPFHSLPRRSALRIKKARASPEPAKPLRAREHAASKTACDHARMYMKYQNNVHAGAGTLGTRPQLWRGVRARSNSERPALRARLRLQLAVTCTIIQSASLDSRVVRTPGRGTRWWPARKQRRLRRKRR